MPFKKNDERINRTGRPPGATNKSTDELRNIFQAFLENNMHTMQDDFDTLEPMQRLSFIEKLAKMILPPPITPEKLSEQQLDQIINNLKNSYHGKN